MRSLFYIPAPTPYFTKIEYISEEGNASFPKAGRTSVVGGQYPHPYRKLVIMREELVIMRIYRSYITKSLPRKGLLAGNLG